MFCANESELQALLLFHFFTCFQHFSHAEAMRRARRASETGRQTLHPPGGCGTDRGVCCAKCVPGLGTTVKLFIRTLASLAETLNEDDNRVIKCFSITITQPGMQTTGVCSGPGSAPLRAASLEPRVGVGSRLQAEALPGCGCTGSAFRKQEKSTEDGRARSVKPK